jgi:hypothetical protein
MAAAPSALKVAGGAITLRVIAVIMRSLVNRCQRHVVHMIITNS